VQVFSRRRGYNGAANEKRGLIDRYGRGQGVVVGSTNTQLGHRIVKLVIRRPLVNNLPTNHWESVVENIQCKFTHYLGLLPSAISRLSRQNLTQSPAGPRFGSQRALTLAFTPGSYVARLPCLNRCL
jgi:hypothetical protein